MVVNAFAGPELDVAVLTDPVTITAYKTQVADQLNSQSGGPKFLDLSERIADMHMETSAQGASVLELDIIDPYNLLLQSGFITVDDGGFLYPPIEINFPKGQSDAWWRLCAVRPSSFSGGPNVVLTFEDRAVAAMRDTNAQSGGIRQSGSNETLAGFIERLVKAASKARGIPIRFVSLVAPSDPNYAAPISTPASFNLPKAGAGSGGSGRQSGGRNNPNKDPGALSPAQQTTLEGYQQATAQMFGITPGGLAGPAGGPLTLSEIEEGASQLFGRLSYQLSPGLTYGTGS